MIPIAKPYLGDEEISAVEKVLKTGIMAQGPKVEELEIRFANLCQTKYAIAVNSGTAALHTALHVLGIKKGDEVITSPFTFIATANTILMQGARPVFVDINKEDFNINLENIKQKVTGKTKAIVTVDLYGQLCDYNEIENFAKEKNLFLIADSAQAVDAEYNGKKAGSFGDISTFSFYATKNIACGEGGIITTNNKEFEKKAKLFRQHGRSDMEGYDYVDLGYNYRMTDISAAILLEQMKKLSYITEKRLENAVYLTQHLGKIRGITVPNMKQGKKHVFHQYTIKVGEKFKLSRDELKEYLGKRGIGCAVYYPKPLHLVENIKRLGYKEGDFPVAEEVSKQVLSLPVHPHLKKEELGYIIKVFREIK